MKLDIARRPIRVLALLVLMMLALAACQKNVTVTTSVAQNTQPATFPTDTAIPPTQKPEATAPGMATSEPQLTPTQTASVEPTAAPQATPRAELEATDPSTVQLASGEIQVVEFFAFW